MLVNGHCSISWEQQVPIFFSTAGPSGMSGGSAASTGSVLLMLRMVLLTSERENLVLSRGRTRPTGESRADPDDSSSCFQGTGV